MRCLRRLLLTVLAVALLAPAALIALFRLVDPPITPLMLIRLAEGHSINKSWRELERISPHLARAVIASEDNRFCEHAGFDLTEVAGQIDRWLDGGRPRGASTLTMQTAKNLFLWPGRDPLRKALEAWLTWQIELLWPKKRILEVYLNIVEFGPGIYGAEAAARTFFSKSARALTPVQGARLTAILPNPIEYSPVSPSVYVSDRAVDILRLIPKLGPLLACVPL
ncbi:MAG: monofunctional biosynthetic peptidoglycan transglycosylase [Rhodospirillales bacterium]